MNLCEFIDPYKIYGPDSSELYERFTLLNLTKIYLNLCEYKIRL